MVFPPFLLFGFRQGRSTEDAINCTLAAVDEIEDRYALAILVDISGAFDGLWSDADDLPFS